MAFSELPDGNVLCHSSLQSWASLGTSNLVVAAQVPSLLLLLYREGPVLPSDVWMPLAPLFWYLSQYSPEAAELASRLQSPDPKVHSTQAYLRLLRPKRLKKHVLRPARAFLAFLVSAAFLSSSAAKSCWAQCSRSRVAKHQQYLLYELFHPHPVPHRCLLLAHPWLYIEVEGQCQWDRKEWPPSLSNTKRRAAAGERSMQRMWKCAGTWRNLHRPSGTSSNRRRSESVRSRPNHSDATRATPSIQRHGLWQSGRMWTLPEEDSGRTVEWDHITTISLMPLPESLYLQLGKAWFYKGKDSGESWWRTAHRALRVQALPWHHSQRGGGIVMRSWAVEQRPPDIWALEQRSPDSTGIKNRETWSCSAHGRIGEPAYMYSWFL